MGLRINTNVASSERVPRRSSVPRHFSQQIPGAAFQRPPDQPRGGRRRRPRHRGRLSLGGPRLTQVAQRNAQDGVSLVQTAEGALSETTNILQRIRELGGTGGERHAEYRQPPGAEHAKLPNCLARLKISLEDTQFNGISRTEQRADDYASGGRQREPDARGVRERRAHGSDLRRERGISLSIASLRGGGDQHGGRGAAQREFPPEHPRCLPEPARIHDQYPGDPGRELDGLRERYPRRGYRAGDDPVSPGIRFLSARARQCLPQSNVVPQTALQLLG